MTTNRKPWDHRENRAVVSLYFAMLDAELTGQAYTKAAMIRQFRGEGIDRENLEQFELDRIPLANRSRGSIEAKLMNCSAAHAKLDPGAETMDGHGYRALANYQKALETAMDKALSSRAVAQAFNAGTRAAQ